MIVTIYMILIVRRRKNINKKYKQKVQLYCHYHTHHCTHHNKADYLPKISYAVRFNAVVFSPWH